MDFNGLIKIDKDMRRPILTMDARVGCRYRGKVIRVSEDILDMKVRVSLVEGEGSWEEFTATQDANGDWLFTVSGEFFSHTCGLADGGWYELRGVAVDEEHVCIGRGRVICREFSAQNKPDIPQ